MHAVFDRKTQQQKQKQHYNLIGGRCNATEQKKKHNKHILLPPIWTNNNHNKTRMFHAKLT